MIIDVRDGNDTVDGVRFDDSDNHLFVTSGILCIRSSKDGDVSLCFLDDVDHLIAAIRKAKELWGSR